jgi:integrase
MASISLMLKDNKATGKTRIIAKLTDGRKYHLRISTKHSVLPKHWSKANNNVLSADSNAVAINKDIKQFTQKIISIYNEATGNGIIPDLNYFQSILKPTIEAKELETNFFTVFEYFLTDKKTNIGKNTYKKFHSLRTHLEAFEKYRKIPLQFPQINTKLIKDLQNYFYEVAKLNTQTTAKYLGVLKSFLNWTIQNNYNTNREYKDFTIKQQPTTKKVILNSDDLNKLRNFKNTDKIYLNNVKDLLILSCLTGLRFSDYSRIKAEHLINGIDGNAYISIMQKKTNENVEIPLTNEANEIVKKLIKREIHPISNQKMNSYVKELCKLCNIDDDFEKVEYRGNLRTIKTIAKYELITTHTGRRTFATNLLLKGVPAEVVMLFTGHKDYASFSKYVNIPKETKMQLVRNALVS